MISPESALNPVIVPEVRVAVQWKIDPRTSEVRARLVDSPEQIVFICDPLVIFGGWFVVSCIVSLPLHPFALVTATAYIPAFPVVYVWFVPTVKPEPRSFHT
jgi:hypothetical protein